MAERPGSPSADRVVAILTLLAEHPTERMTLTRIADRLDQSKPTCLGVLVTLTEAGLLTRDDAKTYGLGPTLLRIGTAAENGVAPLDLIRPHLERLHEVVEASCLLVGGVDDHVVVLDRRGPVAGDDTRDLVGERFPLVPPLGLVNNLWNPDAVLAEWAAREPLVAQAPAPGRLAAIAAGARSAGYVVERVPGTGEIGHGLVARLVSAHLPEQVLRQVLGHLPAVTFAEYEVPGDVREGTGAVSDQAPVVSNVTAPIFDRRGRQRWVLTVVLDRRLSARARRHVTAALTAASRAATDAIGGLDPWRT